MAKRKHRFEVSGERNSLKSNPFEQLGRLSKGAASSDEIPEETSMPLPAPPPVPRQEPLFTVGRTKKGGLPISLEKRARGKTVTVIRNVSGNAKEFLALLKKRCGAGGVLRDGDVELQGDHRAQVEAFLNLHEKNKD